MGGPVLTKLGRSVRYHKADVLAWIEANSRRIRSTAELGAKR
jgi:predicted DNA-binding transcriptional regulator AlpA